MEVTGADIEIEFDQAAVVVAGADIEVKLYQGVVTSVELLLLFKKEVVLPLILFEEVEILKAMEIATLIVEELYIINEDDLGSVCKLSVLESILPAVIKIEEEAENTDEEVVVELVAVTTVEISEIVGV